MVTSGTGAHRGATDVPVCEVGRIIDVATVDLENRLFSSAVGLSLCLVLFSIVSASMSPFRHDHIGSLAVGAVVVGLALALFLKRGPARRQIRRHPSWLLLAAALGVAVQWADGGWRSTFFLASFSVLTLSVPTIRPGRLRGILFSWPVATGIALAAGYVAVLWLGNDWQALGARGEEDTAVAFAVSYVFVGLTIAVMTNRVISFVDRLTSDMRERTGQDVVIHLRLARPAARLRTVGWGDDHVAIVRNLANGMSRAEIAREMDWSVSWVRKRLEEMRKLAGVRRTHQLITLASDEGLLDREPPAATRIYGMLETGLFKSITMIVAGLVALGLVLVPLNRFNQHPYVSLAFGGILLLATLLARVRHVQFHRALQERPEWLLGLVALAGLVLLLDGERSSYYLASWSPVAFAVAATRPDAVRPHLRSWPFRCAALLGLGYLISGMVNGFGFADEPDPASVVMNVGGYFMLALAITRMDVVLNRFVEAVAAPLGAPKMLGKSPEPDCAFGWSGEERDVARLALVEGLTRQEIAERLGIRPRQARRRLESARLKAGASSTDDLAALVAARGVFATPTPRRRAS